MLEVKAEVNPSRATVVLLTAIIVIGFLPMSAVQNDQVVGTPLISSSTSVQASLTHTPEEVYSWQPVLIFAHAIGVFDEIKLNATFTTNVDANVSFPGLPYSESRSADLPLVPWASGWYVTAIPGLPACTIEFKPPLLPAVKAWINSTVTYQLVIDGIAKAAGNYTVKEGVRALELPPVAVAMIYDVLEDPDLLNETQGLAPRGWVISAGESVNILITAFDDKGLDNVSFGYSVSGGAWIEVSPNPDPLMGTLKELVDAINNIIQHIVSIIPVDLPPIYIPLSIYNATIQGQTTGNYVLFRANATDVDANNFTSPMGFYYIVNKTSPTRILIVDPHVKLWLLQENVELLLKALKQHANYKLPADFTGNMTLTTRVSEVLERYGVVPFHHWELLGKHYNLYIAWPDERIVDLLKNQAEGGFEPCVIFPSNLYLGSNVTERLGPWNWDLKDIKIDGKSVLEHIIGYVKQRHAGLIATHGTLSDWIVWLDCDPSQHYKVGTRGHVGNTIWDLNPIDEGTLAALLGMPQLAIWELVRDEVAKYLCEVGEADPRIKAIALAIGSLPLQVPFIPSNESLKITPEGENHTILQGLPEEFDIIIPSIYAEFGFKAYTQVGWQLAMPRALAYTAWWWANETRPLAEQLVSKWAKLVENATDKVILPENASRILDSLEWGLERLYRSIISANITGVLFNITANIPGIDPVNMPLDIDYRRLLQLLPVKVIAVSMDGLAAVIAHDKYWDQNGYRAAYLSFEVEASNSSVAENLLLNAVEWAKQWQYLDITTLLGKLVRVPKYLAETFNETLNALPGSVTLSNGTVLVEEGCSVVEVNASQPGLVHLLIAHPTTNKVNITLLEGQTEIYSTLNVSQGITGITLKVYEKGMVKLGITADPRSSLNSAYFSVKQEADTTSPSIGTPSQDPPEDNVQPDQQVTVSVNVTDTQMGVREVILSYSTDGGATWTNVTMNRANGDIYVGEIPGFPAGTIVNYKITACDNAGNPAVKDNAGQYYVYTVIPEFPTLPLLLLMFIMLTAAIIFIKKKITTKEEMRKLRSLGCTFINFC